MGEFVRVGENLVRHRAGNYYLRAKVGGKFFRESLGTDDLRAAKRKRDLRMDALRRSAAAWTGGDRAETVGEALAIVGHRLATAAHTKQRTKDYYAFLLRKIAGTLPLDRSGRAWGAGEVREWWQRVAGSMAAPQANVCLSLARRVAAVLVESGTRADDPTAGLRRVRAVQKPLETVSRHDMERVIASIRAQRLRASEEAANFVAWLAFSGMRHGEVRALEWEHVGREWVTVAGGEGGTKNRKVRRVPITAPLGAVMDRMRYPGAVGPVFTLASPRQALDGACRRLGLPHLRVHDLRHFFASLCLSSGIDVATVARWLGHSDGGALLLRTYAHLLDDHSLESARKIAGHSTDPDA